MDKQKLWMVNLTLNKYLLTEAESETVYRDSTVDVLREGEDLWLRLMILPQPHLFD